MLLGDARVRDERSLDIEKTEHRLLHGEQIHAERTANRQGARMDALGRDQIRESEKRPLMPMKGLEKGAMKNMRFANYPGI